MKRIRMALVMVLLGLFVTAACGGSKSVSVPTPTPTPSPAEQRKELLEKLSDPEKEVYDTSTFLFDLRGQEAYDQLGFLTNSLSRELVAEFFNKNDELLGSFALRGFSFGGKIIIPDPWFLATGGSTPPEDYKGFRLLAVPEQIFIGVDKSPFVDEKYGLYIFDAPAEFAAGIPDFPKGHFLKLKSMDVVFIGNGEGYFTSGQIFELGDEDTNGLALITYQGFVRGGATVFVLRNGSPEVIGVVISAEGDMAVIIDIDIVLNQKTS